MQHSIISVEDVHRQLIKLNPSKSESADEIHPKKLHAIWLHLWQNFSKTHSSAPCSCQICKIVRVKGPRGMTSRKRTSSRAEARRPTKCTVCSECFAIVEKVSRSRCHIRMSLINQLPPFFIKWYPHSQVNCNIIQLTTCCSPKSMEHPRSSTWCPHLFAGWLRGLRQYIRKRLENQWPLQLAQWLWMTPPC